MALLLKSKTLLSAGRRFFSSAPAVWELFPASARLHVSPRLIGYAHD